MMMLALLLCIGSAHAAAQSYRSTVNEGNEYYRQQEYDRAREKYEQAAADDPDRIESYFNAGNAAYRAASEHASADDIQAALQAYEKAGTRIENTSQLARTFYNAGNTFLQAAEKGMENPLLQQAAGGQGADMRKQGYMQAIEMYKRTLKLDPTDADARYNLTYARKKLEEMQKQDQNQDKEQKKDQKQDNQQDEQQQDKSKDEQQQKKDQQNQDQQQQQNQKDQDQKDDAQKNQQQKSKPEQQQKMSKQQAEQILRALEREEKALQKKKRTKVNARANVEKDW
jgi:tetratricopeptide (TPR) repeat protein